MPPAVYQPAPVENVPLYDFENVIEANGVLEIMPDGYGFLRSSDYNYLSSPDDVYVANNLIKRYGLKTGDVIQCHVRPPRDGEKYFPLTSIEKINGRLPADVRDRIPFEHLTPLFPDEKYNLCNDPHTTNMSTRVVDLFSPIGKGQRALIVAQPKTGKTILMKDIANAIAANHPEAYLMMLLKYSKVHPAMLTINFLDLDGFFDTKVFRENTERAKPHGDPLIEAAKRLGITDMSRVLYVGDAVPDILSARDAGADFALVGWTKMSREELDSIGPDYVIEVPDQLPCIIKGTEL